MARGDRQPIQRDDETGSLLGELFGDYSDKRATTWLERKFLSFDTSKAKSLSVGKTTNERDNFKSARILGYVRTMPTGKKNDANRPVLVASVAMKREITERSSRQVQFNFAKKVLQEAVRGDTSGLDGFPSQGLFFFHDGDRYFRLSFVSGEMDGKKFKFNSAKRQSFFINPRKQNNVAKSRLNQRITTFEELKDAFSVEALTKEFYARLFEWYEWTLQPQTGVAFPNEVDDKFRKKSGSDDKKYNSVAVIRLITRLMFVWFVRQRGIVPDELFTTEGAARMIKRFRPASMEDDNYYRCVLQNLFFATFNSRPDKRKFVRHSYQGKSEGFFVKTQYRCEKEFVDAKAFLDMMRDIPFLNCALFDCLDREVREEDGGGYQLFDGFSAKRERQARVPNGLFFDSERGIIPLFDRYEFTIDENNADDSDIALDPELLGKVFENLLGAFNPETKDTARNATGSFYTPREIVDYMVVESLKRHLKTRVPELKDEWVENLFDWNKGAACEALPFGGDVAAKARDAIYACKILDPACGSGAFPMGILHAMVRLLNRLDPNNTDLKDRVIRRYRDEKSLSPDPMETDETRAERLEAIEKQFNDGLHHPDYTRKLYLIENCIYGVDIQPIAVQISKLRFFISLLCDQLRENRNADWKGVDLLSLPNLEAKFVCANTLVALPDTEEYLKLGDSRISSLRDELQENRNKVFRARTYTQKQKLKKKDLELRDQIREAVKSTLAKPDEALIKCQRELIAECLEERKQYETPKMVRRKKAVQGELFGEPVQSELGYEDVDLNKAKRDEIDGKIDHAMRLIAKEEKKLQAVHDTTVGELANLVAGWDPYDQNASSSFFDPQWMFNISNGFDIVIGNPPYGAELSEMEKSYCQNNYQSAKTIKGVQKGSIDTYTLFVERGLDLLMRGGVNVYILPMPVLSNDAMTGIHNYIFRCCGEVKCSSYAVRPQPVFENAVVDTSILLLVRTDSPCSSLLSTKMYRKRAGVSLSDLVANLSFVDVVGLCLRGRIPKIGSPIERDILRKILNDDHYTIGSLLRTDGKGIFYRIAGGRYFKVVTDHPTGSSQDRKIYFESDWAMSIGAILSSTLSFWFYQVYSDNHHWKSFELESFRIPKLSKDERIELDLIYRRYLADIENNAVSRTVSKYSSYNVNSFKEYKIGYSKKIIDEIDDFIGPLYGLTKEEIEFIKNYELEFRLSDDDMVEAAGVKIAEPQAKKQRRAKRPVATETPTDEDDEVLE